MKLLIPPFPRGEAFVCYSYYDKNSQLAANTANQSSPKRSQNCIALTQKTYKDIFDVE